LQVNFAKVKVKATGATVILATELELSTKMATEEVAKV